MCGQKPIPVSRQLVNQRFCRRVGNTGAALGMVLGGIAFLLVAVLWTHSLLRHLPPPERPVAGMWGLCDFRALVYYPPRVVLAGKNPYDSAQYHQSAPVGNIFPLYSPLLILGTVPFAALPLPASQLLFCAANLALCFVLAWVAIRCAGTSQPGGTAVVWLAVLILVSQPGRANYNWGQVGFYTALAAIGGAYLAPGVRGGRRSAWRWQRSSRRSVCHLPVCCTAVGGACQVSRARVSAASYPWWVSSACFHLPATCLESKTCCSRISNGFSRPRVSTTQHSAASRC